MRSPLGALNEYYKAFSTLDLSAIVSHFSEPCMSIGPQGVFSAGNREALATAFRLCIDSLKAKGYARSEFVEVEVTTLDDTAALVRGVAVRYKGVAVRYRLDESELERIPISYLMHRSADGWKIAAMVLPT